MSTLTSGTYNLTGMLPSHWLQWDDYRNRIGRYEVLNGYYHNVAYHSITTYAQSLKHIERLYKHVRGVYNPASRAVETYVSKVYGGALDTQNAQAGAIPIVTDNDALRMAITQLWMDSRWGQKKSLYVRNGANFGDAIVNIVDDIQTGIVYIEPVDPRKVKSIETDSKGSITRIIFEYYMRVGKDNKKYTEIVTPELFQTFLDDEPAALNTNGRGEDVAEWRNEYGFVPCVHVPHRDVGMTYGGNAWYTVMHKINELNDLASIQNDGARRQVQMPLFGFGISHGNVDVGSDNSQQTYDRSDTPRKDTQTLLNYNKDGRIEAIAPVLDLANSMGLINEILAEIERDLPELSLHRLRDGGNVTAPGVRAAYDDAIARIQEARGNYDAGLVEAQKMAIAIGGMRGYDGYSGFNLMSLERGDLDHYIEDRPVINDTMSSSEMISMTLQAMASKAPRTVYTKIGWSDSDADEILEAQESSTASFMQNFTPPQDETPPEAPQDAVNNNNASMVSEADILAADEMVAAA